MGQGYNQKYKILANALFKNVSLVDNKNMDIESLKKHTHPDANPNLNRFQTWGWYICVSFPFLVFITSASIALVIYFTQDNNHSVSVSNVGFGMLIGLSSICFSYYKLLQTANYVRLHCDVQKAGELFLTSAIAFILSSALKYAYFVIIADSFSYHWFGHLIQTSYTITFLTAEGVCIVGLVKIIDVLFIRMTTPIR
jgi:hypothetical protein